MLTPGPHICMTSYEVTWLSVKVPHRTAPTIADNPPNECVVKVEFSIEAEGDTCDIKITDGNTKLPGDTNETNGKKGQDGTMESTGALKQPPSTEEPNSAKDPEAPNPTPTTRLKMNQSLRSFHVPLPLLVPSLLVGATKLP